MLNAAKRENPDYNSMRVSRNPILGLSQDIVNDETLTVEEAAAFLHVHPDTVKARARAGEIPAYKPGRKWVFLYSELLDYLRTQRPENTPTRFRDSRPSIVNLRAAQKRLDDQLGPVTKSKKT